MEKCYYQSLVGIIFLFISSSWLVVAQEKTTNEWNSVPNIIVETFNQEDGLPVVSLTDLEMGADNHLYIASFGGLSRFNGSQFELINSENYPNLPSSRIKYLRASPDSAMWIFDETFNVSRWKKGVLSTYGLINGEGDRAWWLFKVAPNGTAWAINNERASVFNEKNGFTELTFPLKNSLIDFIPSSDTTAWVLTEDGFYSFNTDNLTSIIDFPNPLASNSNIAGIEQLKIFSDGLIAGFTTNCVFVFDPKTNKSHLYNFAEVLEEGIILIVEKSPNKLLLRTPDRTFEFSYSSDHLSLENSFSGISSPITNATRFNLKAPLIDSFNRVFYNEHELYDPGQLITASVNDKEGNLWINVSSIGLQRVSLNPFTTFNKENGLMGNNIYSVIEDENSTVWLTSLDGGVSSISDSTIHNWDIDANNPNPPIIRSIFKAKNGDIIAGVIDGSPRVFRQNMWKDYPLNNSRDESFGSTALSFLEAKEGDFWVGTRSRLLMKKSDSNFFKNMTVDDMHEIPVVQTINQDSNQTIWFGTSGNGLFRYREEIEHFRVFNDESSFSVRDILVENSDTVWLATQQRGLIRVVLDNFGNLKSHASLSKSDGLPDIGVHRILKDYYGYFWLTSNQGLARVSIQSLNDFLDDRRESIWIQNFSENDGLPIREMNGGVHSSGTITNKGFIWVPTQNGVVRFNPGNFFGINPYEQTELYVSKISTTNRAVSLYGESVFSLAKGVRSVTLSINTLHYSNASELSLEYQIPSLGIDWQKLESTNQINIANIPRGTHSVSLRLFGIPSDMHEISTFKLIVPAFFYEQIWFISLVFFSLIIGIGGLFQWKLSASKRREVILEERVANRTLELEEQKIQLEKALYSVKEQAKKVDKLNEEKTNFFITITHELKTPLSLIKGPLGLLKDANLYNSINRQEQLETIERSSIQLDNFINNLLELMQLQESEKFSTISAINLSSFIRLRVAEFNTSELLKGKKLILIAADESVIVHCDIRLLHMVVSNLISNSIKYTRIGDLIELKITRIEDNIIFEISDTGIGIKKEDLPLIFDPFFRSSIPKKVKGFGIGLSVVKQSLERIGGNITIKSKVNEGTKISVFFPIVKHDLPIKDEIERPDSPIELNETLKHIDTASRQDTPHILLVEDNKELRNFYEQFLSLYFKITSANDGEEALVKLATIVPDLILSDVMMPRIGGLELVKRIRENPAFTQIPIILLSAKREEKNITDSLRAGAQVYLTKPVDNHLLLAQITALLNREKRVQRLEAVSKTNYTQKDQVFVNSVDNLILRHLSEPTLNVQAIAEALHMSNSTLYRKWKKISGTNLNEYILKKRLTETISLIQEKGSSFSEASGICGFTDPAYFSKVFKRHYRVTPSQYFKDKKQV